MFMQNPRVSATKAPHTLQSTLPNHDLAKRSEGNDLEMSIEIGVDELTGRCRIGHSEDDASASFPLPQAPEVIVLIAV